MKTAVIPVFLGLSALMLAGCGTPAKNTSLNSNVDNSKTTAAPTGDALLALDRQANEAYIKSDSKFFERMLSDKFVMREGGQQMDRAAVIRMIAGNKCDVKDWKLEDPQMGKIDADCASSLFKTPGMVRAQERSTLAMVAGCTASGI